MIRHRILAAVLCIFTAATANMTNGQEKPRVTAEQLILPGEILDVDGKSGFVFLPEESKRSKPQPWIMYAPTLLPSYPDSHEKWMHEQFLAAGISIAGVCCTHHTIVLKSIAFCCAELKRKPCNLVVSNAFKNPRMFAANQ